MNDSHEPDIAFESIVLDNGHELTMTVTQDGVWWPWVVDPDGGSDGSDSDGDCAGCWPEHERLGRLPRQVRERIGMLAVCGRPTKSGTPCRNEVDWPGTPCHVHRPG